MSCITDNFSEKFLIDVEKFTVWIVDNPNYKITHSNNGEIFNNNTLIDLFKDFKEPGRYKIDFFIKHVSQKFPIYTNNKEIESHDIKLIVCDFKNNKPKRVPKIFKKSSQPTISETPTISEPSLIEQTISEPTISEPTISEQTISEPTISEPTLIEPTLIEPTLIEPTLIEPTLIEPTLIEPTLIEPTLIEPTTDIVNEDKINNMPIKYDFLINKKFIVNLEDIVFDIL